MNYGMKRAPANLLEALRMVDSLDGLNSHGRKHKRPSGAQVLWPSEGLAPMLSESRISKDISSGLAQPVF
ncbi:hypothetical protein NQ318_002310 [Aromia moschata]|uniref:Uncharacterized protein n=1 Tax=Aromia moschata TaxID=1265417 RepID=A0AAV8Z559_9CUCU|nr:hypothetical protein NQ318_002310 [Aromia moschata]